MNFYSRIFFFVTREIVLKRGMKGEDQIPEDVSLIILNIRFEIKVYPG